MREPVAACLPLLPLIFPAWWVVINSAALANVLTLFRQVKLAQLLILKVSTVTFLCQASHLLRPSTTADPFDDTVRTVDIHTANKLVNMLLCL